jgi:hypothetical protein
MVRLEQLGMMAKATRKAEGLAVVLTVVLPMLIIMSALSACATQRAAVDYDPGVDFTEYRTYAWSAADTEVAANPEDPRISPLTHERIRAAVDQALLAKGFVKKERPDFMIALRTSLSDRQQVHYWGPDPLLWRHGWRRWPYGPFAYDPFFARTTVSTVTEATLAIDMFDAATKQPIWHGHTTRVVGPDDIHPADIQRMVDAILADFPPGLANVPQPSL